LSLDLPEGWLAVDEGSAVKLRYLGPDLATRNATIVYLDQATVIGSNGLSEPAPDDFVGWLMAHPLMRSTIAGTDPVAGIPTTRVDSVFISTVTPETNDAFMAAGAGDLLINANQKWTFFVMAAPATPLLVALTDPSDDDVQAVQDLIKTLRFP
jgi:hypothetical protein